MITITSKIQNLQAELAMLIDQKIKIQEKLRLLAVGDVVAEEGSYGDYFDLKILEIDLENCMLFVHDLSITSRVYQKWISGADIDFNHTRKNSENNP